MTDCVKPTKVVSSLYKENTRTKYITRFTVTLGAGTEFFFFSKLSIFLSFPHFLYMGMFIVLTKRKSVRYIFLKDAGFDGDFLVVWLFIFCFKIFSHM